MKKIKIISVFIILIFAVLLIPTRIKAQVQCTCVGIVKSSFCKQIGCQEIEDASGCNCQYQEQIDDAANCTPYKILKPKVDAAENEGYQLGYPLADENNGLTCITTEAEEAFPCTCKGTLSNINQQQCQSMACSWENDTCTCNLENVGVPSENKCSFPEFFQELGATVPQGVDSSGLECKEAEEEEEEEEKQQCTCEAYLTTSEIESQSTCEGKSDSETQCEWIDRPVENITYCHCKATGQTLKNSCNPNVFLMPKWDGKLSYFCCIFADGTKTEYEYPSGETSDACQYVAQAAAKVGAPPPGAGGPAPGETPAKQPKKPGEITLVNFLGTGNVNIVIGRIVQAVIGISGSAALAVFIYGGALWMFSAGNPEKVKKGRSAMIYAAIGLAVIFLSYTLVAYVLKALG